MFTRNNEKCSDNDHSPLDINECSLNRDNCAANARCSNIIGSFRCSCNLGYAGNGVTCNGT